MARVIEEKIIEKINTWKDGVYCLSVRDIVEIEDGKAIYYLWGSPVITVTGKFIRFCFCGYPSQTTKERISTLLQEFASCHIIRKNWIHYLKMGNDYYKLNESEHYTVKDGILLDSIGNEVEPLKDFTR